MSHALRIARKNSRASAARSGRLLVECLVAMLLLDATAIAVLVSARGIARSSQAARLTTSAWDLAVQGNELAIAAGCSGAIAAGVVRRPQVDVEWAESAIGRQRVRSVVASTHYSALANGQTHKLQWQSAWSCP